MVKITIVGTGYVGLVTGACLAHMGHEVLCCDIDENKIKQLNLLEMPIYEPGLEEIVKESVHAKRLTFTTNVGQAIRESKIVFSAVGTPMGDDHKADLKYVKAVALTFAQNLNSFKIFVNKSTVPVGTCELIQSIVSKEITSEVKFDVVSNPEFLKEGDAVRDCLYPDRIVIGTNSNEAKELMKEVYAPFERNLRPIFYTSIRTAELIKYAANSMLATRISFMNEMAQFCDIIGADVRDVAKGIGLDERIGPRFLHAGVGYGGSCFPKDVKALIESGKEESYDFKILNAVEDVNEDQKKYLVKRLASHINLDGRKVAVWGLAFKANTDDVRESQAAIIIQELISNGANVKAYDPIAQENFEKYYPHLNIEYVQDKYDALKDVDALVIVTEWKEFRVSDIKEMKQLMKGNVIADGRNLFSGEVMRKNGFVYIGIGCN